MTRMSLITIFIIRAIRDIRGFSSGLSGLEQR
jgi:hypothetical protein